MSILDAAKYLIYIASEDNFYSISQLKLQKLLYFSQGFSYLWDGKPLFEKNFEAWQYGPVNRKIYDKYKRYGNSDIPFNGEIDFNLSQENKDTIEAVWRDYKKYDAFELVEITHMEEPWKRVYNGQNNVISNKSIKDYFMIAYC